MIAIVIMCASCGGKAVDDRISVVRYKPDSMALFYNNKAAVLMGEAGIPDDSIDTQLYDSAVIYLDRSIEIDSLYLLAYFNKSQALRRKGELDKALQVLKEIESIRLDGAVIAAQGFVLERMGEMELAEAKYKDALSIYENRLEDDPENEKIHSDIAFIHIFLEDKSVALEEIQDLILNYPNSKQLKMMEEAIEDFDRKEFIDAY